MITLFIKPCVMEQALSFKLDKESFSVHDILDKGNEDNHVQRLIRVVTLIDPSVEINSPYEEDLVLPQDDWVIYSSAVLNITFEFVQNKLCYISFLSDTFGPVGFSENDERLVIREKEIDNKSFVVFISKACLEKDLLPNRYIPLLY